MVVTIRRCCLHVYCRYVQFQEQLKHISSRKGLVFVKFYSIFRLCLFCSVLSYMLRIGFSCLIRSCPICLEFGPDCGALPSPLQCQKLMQDWNWNLEMKVPCNVFQFWHALTFFIVLCIYEEAHNVFDLHHLLIRIFRHHGPLCYSELEALGSWYKQRTHYVLVKTCTFCSKVP